MIPVTIFAGRDVAVFGLGLSGIAAAHAPRRRRRSGARLGRHARGARQGCGTRCCRCTTSPAPIGPGSRRSCSRPAFPLTHPEPHWSVTAAQGGRRRSHRRHRALLPRKGEAGVRRQGRGHHRHQRQIDAPRRSPPISCKGRQAGRAWRQYRPAPSSTFRPSPRASPMFSSCRLFRSTSTPSLAPDAAALINITPDHLDRHGTIENYAAIKARVFAQPAR